MASKKKTIYEWLSTRVTINIRNEENYALKRSIRVSYSQIIVLGSIFFVLFSAFALWTATKVIGIWYNPREDYFNTKKKVIILALSVDSLQEQIRQKDLFISHIKSIIETGEVKETYPEIEQVKKGESKVKKNRLLNLDYLSEVDSIIRKEFEGR